MRGCARTLVTCLLASSVAAAGARPARDVRVAIHLDRPVGRVSPFLFGCALPAPGTPGAEGLLPELLSNRSFEKGAMAGPKPMPEGWSRARGWKLFAFGGRHMIVRDERQWDEPLVLIGRRGWRSYRLTLQARKVDGSGGLCVLFDVQDSRNHLRWTLGANGNCQHVLESVGGGVPRLLAPPVPGRIETGRCYRIDVSLRRGALQCSLDGRLITQVDDARFPHAGFGLGATDATAEYFDLAVYEPKDIPLFLLDNPSRIGLDTLASDWKPLRAEGNKVSFGWDSLYPFNSHFSQSISVDTYEGGDAGICQSGVPIAAGETYRGRVYLRGTGRAVIAASLRTAAGKVLATQALGELTGTWQAHDFVLKPGESDPQADFCITIGGRAAVWVDQVSLAAESARTPWALRSDVVAALRALRPALLCWPAGPSANHSNWQRGIGPADERPVLSVTSGSAPAFEPACNDFGTDEFLALCRELGAEPVIVLNPRFGTLAVQNLLNYCNGPLATPFGKQRAAYGRAEPYGVRYWLLGGERLQEVGGQAYPVTLAELAREMRGFHPTPQLVALGGPLLSDYEEDAREAKQAGPMVSHVAKGVPEHGTPEEVDHDLARAVAEAARELRAHSLHLALVDCGLDDDETSPAPALGLLLNALSRDGGPGAMAAFRCTPPRGHESSAPLVDLLCGRDGAASERAVWALFRSHPMGELLHVKADPAEGSPPPLDLVAGRDGDKVILRVIRRAEQELVVHVKLEGLGNRRLAARADHFVVAHGAGGQAEPWSRAEVPVQGGQLTIALKAGQAAHLVVLRLEGEQP